MLRGMAESPAEMGAVSRALACCCEGREAALWRVREEALMCCNCGVHREIPEGVIGMSQGPEPRHHVTSVVHTSIRFDAKSSIRVSGRVVRR